MERRADSNVMAPVASLSSADALDAPWSGQAHEHDSCANHMDGGG